MERRLPRPWKIRLHCLLRSAEAMSGAALIACLASCYTATQAVPAGLHSILAESDKPLPRAERAGGQWMIDAGETPHAVELE